MFIFVALIYILISSNVALCAFKKRYV